MKTEKSVSEKNDLMTVCRLAHEKYGTNLQHTVGFSLSQDLWGKVAKIGEERVHALLTRYIRMKLPNSHMKEFYVYSFAQFPANGDVYYL